MVDEQTVLDRQVRANGDHQVYVQRKSGNWSHSPGPSSPKIENSVRVWILQKTHLDRAGINGRQLTHYEKDDYTGYPLSMPIKDRTPEKPSGATHSPNLLQIKLHIEAADLIYNPYLGTG